MSARAVPLGLVLRPGGGTTQLRAVATTSRSGNIWTAARETVSCGDYVVVLRAETSSCGSSDIFLWCRTSTGAEGFLNAAYVKQLVTVQRSSGSVSTTLLRKTATTSRSGDVWTTDGGHVANGAVVEVLRAAKSSSGGSNFVWVRTDAGVEGFLNAAYVKQLVTVRRPTPALLRKTATTSHSADVWTTPPVQVANGDVVEVLSAAKSASGPGNFAWVRTAAGSEGFLNVKNIALASAAPPAAPPAAIGSRPLVIAIGDIHGWLHRLKALWAELERRVGSEALAAATIVFLGDYVDRGPDSRGVLDFLIALKASRRPGSTRFIAGNHDFAMAAWLHTAEEHVLPVDASSLAVDGECVNLDETINASYVSGFWTDRTIPGGMHYQGRRWGGSLIYNADHTYRSYGIEWSPSRGNAHHTEFAAAVPASHKTFLRELEWIVELDLEFAPGRMLCVHAGIAAAYPLEDQLLALRSRDWRAEALQPEEFGRLLAFSARKAVLKQHPDLVGRALTVSGHHGKRWSGDGADATPAPGEETPTTEMVGERIVLDVSGGRAGGLPLEAIVLPTREVISVQLADDAAAPSSPPAADPTLPLMQMLRRQLLEAIVLPTREVISVQLADDAAAPSSPPAVDPTLPPMQMLRRQLSAETGALCQRGVIDDAQKGVLKALLDFDPAELAMLTALPSEIMSARAALETLRTDDATADLVDWHALEEVLADGDVSDDGSSDSDSSSPAAAPATAEDDSDTMMPCHFWLIRHGERADATRGGVADKFYAAVKRGEVCQHDAPLTKRGAKQARKGAGILAAHVASVSGFDLQHINTSPLQRCALTAAAYSEALKVPLRMTPALGTICAAVEQHGGRFEINPATGWVRFKPAKFSRRTQSGTLDALSPSAIRDLVGKVYKNPEIPVVADDEHERIVDESFDEAIFTRLGNEARAVAAAAGRSEAHVACCTHREGLRKIVQRLTGKRIHIDYCQVVHVVQTSSGGRRHTFRRLALVDPHVGK